MAPFETNIKTDIPRFQHVDFWCFGLILTIFGLILVNVCQMFRKIWGQTCSERCERSARSERSEHEHCSGPTQSLWDVVTVAIARKAALIVVFSADEYRTFKVKHMSMSS